MNIENKVSNDIDIENNQKSFIETSIGKVINKAINVGLRYLLPDLVEDQIINIKDTIIKNGFGEGTKKAIDSAIELGKSTAGIVTGKFDNISQVQTAIKNGGIIDTASSLLDKAVNATVKTGLINTTAGNIIKSGKNAILNNISNGIENEFESQLDSIEKIDKYVNNWTNYYKSKDFDGMQKEYEKIEDRIKNIIPIENTIKKARNIENLHNIIKKNGKNFDLTETELKLSEML